MEDGYNSNVESFRKDEYPMLRGTVLFNSQCSQMLILELQMQYISTMPVPLFMPNP